MKTIPVERQALPLMNANVVPSNEKHCVGTIETES